LIFVSYISTSILSPSRPFRQGGWVAISTLMVCWFPTLDAASVIQKSIQRTLGTLLGGFLALVCGFLSRSIIPDGYTDSRAVFLHTAYALMAFAVTYASMKVRLSRTERFVDKYNYATVLCLLTLTIALFPFLEQDNPWQKAVYRIINVALGCIIGCVGSILVLPRSTTNMLYQRIQKQCILAGFSSEAVLHGAADVLSGDVIPQGMSDELMMASSFNKWDSTSAGMSLSHNGNSNSDLSTGYERRGLLDSIRVSALHKSFYRVHKEMLLEVPSMTPMDVVLEKYESAIRDWKGTKELFSLFQYDPFQYIVPPSQNFQDGCANILSRSLRIQTTVVLLDGIVRNDPQHFLDEKLHALLTEMGTLIRKMLAVPRQYTNTDDNVGDGDMEAAGASSCACTSNDTAKDRLLERFYWFRFLVNQMASDMIQREALMDSIASIPSMMNRHGLGEGGNDRNKRRSIAVNDGGKHFALLFLQLVEHLVLRSISLYDSWLEMEELPEWQNDSG